MQPLQKIRNVKSLKRTPHLSIINAGLSINTGSNPRQLMVIGFGKCTGSLSHTVADPSPHVLMHNFMWLTKPVRFLHPRYDGLG